MFVSVFVSEWIYAQNTDKTLQVIVVCVLIQQFIEGFVYMASYGILPQFDLRLWHYWSHLPENSVIDVSCHV